MQNKMSFVLENVHLSLVKVSSNMQMLGYEMIIQKILSPYQQTKMMLKFCKGAQLRKCIASLLENCPSPQMAFAIRKVDCSIFKKIWCLCLVQMYCFLEYFPLQNVSRSYLRSLFFQSS